MVLPRQREPCLNILQSDSVHLLVWNREQIVVGLDGIVLLVLWVKTLVIFRQEIQDVHAIIGLHYFKNLTIKKK